MQASNTLRPFKVYKPMTETLPTPLTATIEYVDWIDSLLYFSGGPLNLPLTGYDLHDTFVRPHHLSNKVLTINPTPF